MHHAHSGFEISREHARITARFVLNTPLQFGNTDPLRANKTSRRSPCRKVLHCTNRQLCDKNSIAGQDLLIASWDMPGNGELDPGSDKPPGTLPKVQLALFPLPQYMARDVFQLASQGIVLCPDCRQERFDEHELIIHPKSDDVI